MKVILATHRFVNISIPAAPRPEPFSPSTWPCQDEFPEAEVRLGQPGFHHSLSTMAEPTHTG